MIYQYTGQPGHGKTLHAIDQAIEFRDQGRLVYVCNVRNFDHAKAKMLPLSPEQFRDWPNTVPEGAVVLVDECYEHEMLPKRSPGSKVPTHIKELAKHRHTGRDFIFVCQSPSKQMDEFVHDNIERHTHVRRRFGLGFVHLRIFDRYERNPERAHPLILKRVRLPKRPMGLYESTVLDTTEKKVPWYYPAAIGMLLAVLVGGLYTTGRIKDRFSTDKSATAEAGHVGNGAQATVPPGLAKKGADDKAPKTVAEYAAEQRPRFPTMPWTAPAFDHRPVVSDPQILCMEAKEGIDAEGQVQPASCTCMTEQGTRYYIRADDGGGLCRAVARHGPSYNPYRKAAEASQASAEPQPAPTAIVDQASTAQAPHARPTVLQAGQVASYGAIGVGKGSQP